MYKGSNQTQTKSHRIFVHIHRYETRQTRNQVIRISVQG